MNKEDIKQLLPILITSIVLVIIVLNAGYLLFSRHRQVTTTTIEVERVIEVEKIIYKDISERDLDEYNCPINGNFLDTEEYEKCSKARIQKFIPKWKENTRHLEIIYKELPACSLNWYPEIACTDFGKIKLPE